MRGFISAIAALGLLISASSTALAQSSEAPRPAGSEYLETEPADTRTAPRDLKPVNLDAVSESLRVPEGTPPSIIRDLDNKPEESNNVEFLLTQ